MVLVVQRWINRYHAPFSDTIDLSTIPSVIDIISGSVYSSSFIHTALSVKDNSAFFPSSSFYYYSSSPVNICERQTIGAIFRLEPLSIFFSLKISDTIPALKKHFRNFDKWGKYPILLLTSDIRPVDIKAHSEEIFLNGFCSFEELRDDA